MRNLHHVRLQSLTVRPHQVSFSRGFGVSRKEDIHVSVLHLDHNGGVVSALKPALLRWTENACPDKRGELEGIPSANSLVRDACFTEKATCFLVQLRVGRVAIVHESVYPDFSQQRWQSPKVILVGMRNNDVI